MKEKIIFTVNGILIILFLIALTCVFYSMSNMFNTEIYFPCVSQNMSLKEEMGTITNIKKSLFENADQEGNIRLFLYTDQNTKYFVKINIYNDNYEILERSENV